ncbi:MAG: metallophosphoesterase [Actinomycetota bacterium]|nr:metallophosphoesterase [Actinomycetota bacterium]
MKLRVAVVSVSLVLGMSACGTTSSDRGHHQSPRGTLAGSLLTPRADADASGDLSATKAAAPTASATRVVVAGDIACPPGFPVAKTTCRQGATAALIRTLNPDLVIPLGDEQYETGSLADFQHSYARSWGSLLSRTYPVPGNHEYYTPGASGYYSYFAGRAAPAPGYYRISTNGWQLYLLNSNCNVISCPTEASWLDAEMIAHPTKCSLIAMHHPRFSSGAEHGSSTVVRGLWTVAYNHHADVALSGHDHDYERFARMDPNGSVQPTRGVLEFVAGTGGRSLYPRGATVTGSRYFENTVHGVLELTLASGQFSWSFRDIYGKVHDSGTYHCI